MHNFRSAVERVSTGAVPILSCPTSGMGENGRVTKAGNEGSTAFVNKDV